MEERNNTSTPAPEAEPCSGNWSAFVLGLVVALVLGWWVLPGALQEDKKQPVAFSHKEHVQNQGVACDKCHVLLSDGSFSGAPCTAQCAECHSAVIGSDPEEARFVNDYVKTGREIKSEWQICQKQPDNVFFSHALHFKPIVGNHSIKDVSTFCSHCHPNVGDADTPPVFRGNSLSGYSKDTMLMWTCENCHAKNLNTTNASNACFTCHK